MAMRRSHLLSDMRKNLDCIKKLVLQEMALTRTQIHRVIHLHVQRAAVSGWTPVDIKIVLNPGQHPAAWETYRRRLLKKGGRCKKMIREEEQRAKDVKQLTEAMEQEEESGAEQEGGQEGGQ
jgi:hypothetical protein